MLGKNDVVYGSTVFPAGTVIKNQGVYFDKSKFNTEQPNVKECATAKLPNGVEVTVFKNSTLGQRGRVSIKGNQTIFDHVDYTHITGTNGDDNFVFNAAYGDETESTLGERVINTGKGNDSISGNIGLWPYCGKGSYERGTIVVSDGNLKVSGTAYNTIFLVNGKLDTRGVQSYSLNYVSGVNPKK